VLEPRRQVLFNPGPVNLAAAVKENLFNVELCHRQPEFDALAASVRDRLAGILGFDPGIYRMSLLHGSGSLAVQAALSSLVRGRVLVVRNGVYGDRMADTLRQLPETEVKVLGYETGQPVDLGQLDEMCSGHPLDWVAIVHHETTTGLLNPLAAVSQITAARGSKLVVDAVSSVGAHAVDVGAEAVCFNSSKCLESLPGIGAVAWKADLPVHPTFGVLDVGAYAEGMPTTPNVQAFVALDIALDLMAVEDRAARYRRLAEYVWHYGSHSFEPLLPEGHRSNVLTSFLLGGRDPDDLFERALKHGFVIYQGQGPLRSQIFRVANMGAAMNEDSISDLFKVLAQ
jgi:2-aminoethylphosphonate-pyruvate transaminase